MKNLFEKRGGVSILGVILLAVILILVLSYLDISIKSVVESPQAQENLQYVGGGSVSLWNTYLKVPFTYIWKKVIVELLWESFILNLQRIRDGEPTELEKAAPVPNY